MVPGVSAESPISRRSFLGGALKLGAGVGLGGPLMYAQDAHASARAGGGVIRSEPPSPPGSISYVTRPDLRPIGVSLRSSPAFRASPGAQSYIFCAPKSPHFASPAGAGGVEQLLFPEGADPGLMILDTRGDLVWFKPLPGPTQIPFNFRVQSYRGRPVLTWFEGQVHEAHGIGHYVLADSSYEQITQVHSTRYPADLHEFIVTDQGTALHTAYESRPRRGRSTLLIGHAQEVDIATNRLLFDWSSYPEVPPAVSYVQDVRSYFDYFHINSIDLWPGSARNLLVSARNTSTVYLIDRRTSTVRWRLGGRRSDFALPRQARFYFQHDARALLDGSGLSLFDDASRPSPERVASGKVLRLNQRARTGTLRQRFGHTDGGFITPSQGNLQLLPDGGHVVGWGYQPFFSAYRHGHGFEPPMVLDGRFPLGAASYRTFLFPWVGHPPLEDLVLVVKPTISPGRMRIYVSWNGATEVARWQLHAGRDGDSLAPLAHFPKRGFETVHDVVSGNARQFKVVALDARGAVLGASATVSSD